MRPRATASRGTTRSTDCGAWQPPGPAAARERTSPIQFLREVRSELRKVAWPSRSETVNYSIVVLVTIVVLGTIIYGLDWLFSTFILDLFEV